MNLFGNPGKPRRLRRLAAGTAALTAGLLVTGGFLAASASAHVKVSGIDAVRGGSGVITFRVPSESDTASTTGLLITFPAASPFTSVDVQPKAGWHATVTKKPLVPPKQNDDGDVISSYIASVDYKADNPAAAIPPGQFDMFNLSVGPFPDAASISFSALQTYSDGSTVNWDEQSANGAKPEHPAPTLQLTAAAATTANAHAADSPSAQPQADGSSGGSSWEGITGLIAGLAALVISLVVLAVLLTGRSRGKSAPAT